ncbi:13741_t:CDS:2 [Dentiscutata erythropus]|uniref:13741_t:CDS:1 n=1 Tax=Dentiscutata erythropus TaxID=1348616 RepID=A0A9N9GZ51_9GLOM|nr:13741_t:CDS:2 [Dentiscutata erythropus]
MAKKAMILTKSSKNLNKNVESHDPEYVNNEDFDFFNKLFLNNNVKDSQLQHTCSHSRSQHLYSQSPRPAAYIAERPKLLKIANQIAQYDGLRKSDNEERTDIFTQQESTTFQAFLKCLFFRTWYLKTTIILRCIKLCFPSKKFSYKDISVLKDAANMAYWSYRDALRNGIKKVAKHFIEDFKIKSLSHVEKADLEAYFKEDNWKSFLNRFFEVINKEATFIPEFKKA